MIAIIDYGLGNVKAFANLYKGINVHCKIVKDAEELKGASKIILPGVGAFDYAMEALTKSGLCSQLNHMVLNEKVPVLGICVGMQIMALSSEEGTIPGLGWINGIVKKFDFPESSTLSVPHMGWNDTEIPSDNPLLSDLNNESRFYFLHSYYFSCESSDSIIATTSYGQKFTSAVTRDNIFGVQFHPEKSHKWGVKVLENFSNL